MGLPIYVDICAHASTTCGTTGSVLSISFIRGIVSNLHVDGCPFLDLRPVVILQLLCRHHSLTRPLAPGMISEAVATGAIDIFTSTEKREPAFNLHSTLISTPTGYVIQEAYRSCRKCETSDLWAILATDK